MPTYEYKCEDCAHVFEIEQRIREKPLTQCPKCTDGKVRRLISGGAGISFKGKGFYVTDNGPKKNKKSEINKKSENSPCGSCPKAKEGSCG